MDTEIKRSFMYPLFRLNFYLFLMNPCHLLVIYFLKDYNPPLMVLSPDPRAVFSTLMRNSR